MIIYKSTNKITGKIYIGQTTHTLDKRIKGHIKESKINKNRPFLLSINKARTRQKWQQPQDKQQDLV